MPLPPGPSPSCKPSLNLGFPPFPYFTAAREKEEEEGDARRVAADAPKLEAVRGREEPDLSPREEEDVRVEQESEQSKKESAAVYAYAEPSTSSARR